MTSVGFKLETQYYDISPLVSAETAVFPGDTPFSRTVVMDFPKGDHLGLSDIRTTVHIGAHTDAPNHYHVDGTGIDQRRLEYYFGPCQVITVNLPRGARVTPKDVRTPISAKRVLFKTGSYPNPNEWNGDFNALSPELVNDLHSKGVILVGIDTPSIDPAEDKELVTHLAVFKNNMAILEGIVLNDVSDGKYRLIALPLKLKDADASPVRAILTKDVGPETWA